MEVSGKRTEEQSLAASFTKASAEDFEFYCEPCDSEGNHVEANGYCKNCEEFLCVTCYTSHRRLRLTRNHILLDKKKMPKVQKPKNRETECIEKCSQHQAELIIYYCKNHDVVGCHECMSSNHSDCLNEYIPDIASGTIDSIEYNTMLQELDDSESEAIQMEKKANEDKAAVGSCYTKAIKDMQKFKQEVNNELDKMEQLFLKETRKAKETAVSTLNDELNDCNVAKNSVEGMKKSMKQRDVSASQIFVQMKLNKTRLDGCRKMLHNRKTAKSSRTFKFEPDKVVRDKLESNEGFGGLVFAEQTEDLTLDTERKQVDSTFCCKLNVKSSSDKNVCDIFAIDMLSPQELILADINNESVKIFGMRDYKITHERKMSIQPVDLSVLDKDKFAVLCIYELVVMHKSVNLLTEKTLKLHGQSYGLRCIKGNFLILSHDPFPKINLLNQEGEILRTILSDPNKRILQYPNHIEVSKDEMSIYVSDYKSENKITRLSIAGDVIDVYKNQNDDDKIEQPRKIAFVDDDRLVICDFFGKNITVADDGSVFVCDFFGDNIRMSSGDLSDMKTSLSEADSIKGPQAIYFCNKERKLFVANYNCDKNFIYSLKW